MPRRQRFKPSRKPQPLIDPTAPPAAPDEEEWIPPISKQLADRADAPIRADTHGEDRH